MLYRTLLRMMIVILLGPIRSSRWRMTDSDDLVFDHYYLTTTEIDSRFQFDQ